MISEKKIDLHMHSTVSDGSDTPEEIVARVKESGIGVFSVTDHDAIKAGTIIRKMLSNGDLAFICGAEFSCEDEFGNYHILAYFDDPSAASINGLVEKGHALRMQKLTTRLDYLNKEFGFAFPRDEVDKLMSLDNPGKPHIGNLMVKLGYADSIKTAIYDYINKLHVSNSHVRPEDAIENILGGNGIPVLAHPFFGDGDQLVVGSEMEQRLKRLMKFGLCGVEAFYSGFTRKLTKEMLGLADKYGLFVTAGSDYHGKNKMVCLGDNGLDDADEYPSGLVRFLEKFGVEV
ncbi:MAG: PHP domain-containing protein [Clostridia bacterium]|nr:PHP domain-containing protein [Clostridia bacterium]